MPSTKRAQAEVSLERASLTPTDIPALPQAESVSDVESVSPLASAKGPSLSALEASSEKEVPPPARSSNASSEGEPSLSIPQRFVVELCRLMKGEPIAPGILVEGLHSSAPTKKLHLSKEAVAKTREGVAASSERLKSFLTTHPLSGRTPNKEAVRVLRASLREIVDPEDRKKLSAILKSSPPSEGVIRINGKQVRLEISRTTPSFTEKLTTLAHGYTTVRDLFRRQENWFEVRTTPLEKTETSSSNTPVREAAYKYGPTASGLAMMLPSLGFAAFAMATTTGAESAALMGGKVTLTFGVAALNFIATKALISVVLSTADKARFGQ